MGMGVGETSLFPNGNVPYSCFVKLDTSAEGKCLVAGSGDDPFGVAGAMTHNMAISIGGVDVDDGYAGVANGPAIKIYGPGATKVPIRLGGTVSVGSYLKPNTNGDGRAIATTTDKDKYGAIARQAGAANDIIECDVIRGQLSV